MNELSGLLACTLRIRRCFNMYFIHRQDEGELQLNADFCQEFSQMENWGLLERFWAKYPTLVENLDSNAMLQEKHLMPLSC